MTADRLRADRVLWCAEAMRLLLVVSAGLVTAAIGAGPAAAAPAGCCDAPGITAVQSGTLQQRGIVIGSNVQRNGIVIGSNIDRNGSIAVGGR
ncbi:hypothetical protein AB0F72_09680 [Actinoplanes sp. NPDC023936]|uniref:hypothetical protein n=1 Tax=Actinoplanes sp. NPDC023936 TaxID=3154910 RepID=UPI0034092040